MMKGAAQRCVLKLSSTSGTQHFVGPVGPAGTPPYHNTPPDLEPSPPSPLVVGSKAMDETPQQRRALHGMDSLSPAHSALDHAQQKDVSTFA